MNPLEWVYEYFDAGYAADYYAEWLRGSERALSKVNTTGNVCDIGFLLQWGAMSLNDTADMFILDPLRLGRGSGEAATASNGWQFAAGVISDLGRATAFLPIGRIFQAGRIGTASGTRATRVAAGMTGAGRWLIRQTIDPNSKLMLCAFVSVTQGLRHTGRLFMSIGKVGEIAGVKQCGNFFYELHRNAPNMMSTISEWLSRLKIVHHEVSSAKSVPQLLAHAQATNKGGVYVFGVNWRPPVSAPGGTGRFFEEMGHCMYIGQTAAGEWRIFDKSGVVAKSLKELEVLAKRVGYDYSGIALGGERLGEHLVPIFIPNSRLLQETSNGIQAAVETLKISPFIVTGVTLSKYIAAEPKKR